MEEKRLDRIEDKLDLIDVHLSNINITLAKQSVILEEHVRRSTLLEEQVKPMQDKMHEIKGAVLFVKVIGWIVAVLETLRHFILK